MNKEKNYRALHSVLCVFAVIFGNGIGFLAGAGKLFIIAQACIWVAVSLQWNVIIRGTKQDRIEKTAKEIKEFSESIEIKPRFINYTYLHPIARRWYYRWYDKLRGITYVHLWAHTFDLDNAPYEFESEIRFPITNKQLFEMKLKAHIDMKDPTDVIPVLEYIGTDLSARILAGPKES